MSLTTEFSSQQYDFYISKGFSLYNVSHKEREEIREHFYFLLPEELNHKNYQGKKIELSNKEQFVSKYSKYRHVVYYENANKFNLEFLVPFVCNNLKDSKEIINNSYSYGVSKVYILVNKLIEALNFEQTLSLIDKSGVRELSLFDNPIETQGILLNKFSLEQTKEFWDRFLKPRKTELNKPTMSSKYYSFLLDTFGADNVEVFTPYFNKLQSYFNPVDVNFLEQKELKNTTLLVIDKKYKLFR